MVIAVTDRAFGNFLALVFLKELGHQLERPVLEQEWSGIKQDLSALYQIQIEESRNLKERRIKKFI